MNRCHSHQPYPIYTTVLTGKNLPPNVGYRPKIPKNLLQLLENPRPETPPGAMKEKIIQTIFRESEAQTDPYEVDVEEIKDKGMEILSLTWLTYNHGLPAGLNEVNTIERARQRRSWEAALPLPLNETMKEMRNMILQAIEINEWHYREETISAIGELRMEIAEKMIKQCNRERKLKCEERLTKYTVQKRDEKNKKIQKLRLQFGRELRKLLYERRKVNRKYHRWNVIEEFTDKTSELYAPQIRFGEDPARRHEVIRPKCQYLRIFRKLEVLHHTPYDVPEPVKPLFDFVANSKPNTSGVCMRATNWTEEYLTKLYYELKHIRRRTSITQKMYFKKKKVFEGEAMETSAVDSIPDEEEDMFQSCLLLQKVIKGRAIQAVMFEGRVKCQELIEELKSTHALQNNLEDVNAEFRRRMYDFQRQAEIQQLQERRKQEILAYLEGKTMGDMLDYLSKELLRLQNERRTHAMALAADRERHRREAAEAGRRQLEEKRRREHDEMFKQIMKLHQNNVQRFLEETFVETQHWMAQRDARAYVMKLAKQIDQAANETTLIPVYARPDDLIEEQIAADLIHNFALPEVEKRIVRRRLQERQRNYLKVCHDEVYSHIEKVVTGKRTREGMLLPLPMVGKHKIPPLVRVKYLRLKRTHESSSSSLTSSHLSDLNDEFFQGYAHLKATFEKTETQQQQETNDNAMWSSGFSKQDIIIGDEEDKVKEENTN